LDGFPHASCISVNEQIVHGVPTERILNDGDIITVDIGVSYKGHHTDAARTFPVGDISSNRDSIIRASYRALDIGISNALPNNRVGDISYSIQKEIMLSGYETVLEYGGHGIGLSPHSNPFIPNYGTRGKGGKLVDGQCVAIEPILIKGSNKVEEDKVDGWTVFSPGGFISSHVEDTIIIADPPVVLTRRTLKGIRI